MKKLLTFFSIAIAFAFLVVPAFAKVERVAGSWVINTPKAIVFTCGGTNYPHTLNTVSQNLSTGSFTGTGTYDTNHSYTWDITGNTTGNAITFHILYTGVAAGTIYNGVGIIASNGSISGNITSGNCQSFSMSAGTATQTQFKNHGQYVKSMENKQEAAQSRVGMPVKSNGHTK